MGPRDLHYVFTTIAITMDREFFREATLGKSRYEPTHTYTHVPDGAGYTHTKKGFNKHCGYSLFATALLSRLSSSFFLTT